MTKITINDLAVMMKEGFDEMQKNFDSQQTEFNDFKNHVNKEFSNVKKNASKLKDDMVELKEDMVELKEDMVELKEDMVELKEVVQDIDTSNDLIVKGILDMSAENAASVGARLRQQDEIDTIRLEGINNQKTITSHETRIKKLETTKNNL